MRNAQKLEIAKAETFWVHMFKAMIDSGEAAKMGATAFLVYTVIKSHADYNTGDAFPGLEVIAEKAGITTRQVMRELRKLEQMGYVRKYRVGRKSHYQLREKIPIRDRLGNLTAVATWDYVPKGVRAAVDELKHLVVTGVFESASVVNIERLNIQVNNSPGNTQFNVENMTPTPLSRAYAKLLERRPFGELGVRDDTDVR